VAFPGWMVLAVWGSQVIFDFVDCSQDRLELALAALMSPRSLPPDDRLAPLDDVARQVGRDRRTPFCWIADGLLTPYKKRGDRRTHIDLAELPEAGRPGSKPRARRDSIR
jgi:hypothetical protein